MSPHAFGAPRFCVPDSEADQEWPSKLVCSVCGGDADELLLLRVGTDRNWYCRSCSTPIVELRVHRAPLNPTDRLRQAREREKERDHAAEQVELAKQADPVARGPSAIDLPLHEMQALLDMLDTERVPGNLPLPERVRVYGMRQRRDSSRVGYHVAAPPTMPLQHPAAQW